MLPTVVCGTTLQMCYQQNTNARQTYLPVQLDLIIVALAIHGPVSSGYKSEFYQNNLVN